jgi:hypothetical protein
VQTAAVDQADAAMPVVAAVEEAAHARGRLRCLEAMEVAARGVSLHTVAAAPPMAAGRVAHGPPILPLRAVDSRGSDLEDVVASRDRVGARWGRQNLIQLKKSLHLHSSDKRYRPPGCSSSELFLLSNFLARS